MADFKPQFILFDLDGTLTDSEEGILNSVKYALEPHGIELPYDTLKKFIGPPLLVAFSEYAGLSPEESEKTVARYRERYSTIGLFENRVYDGVPEMLRDIKNSGKKVILATAKPLVYASRILEHFDLSKYFDLQVGADFQGGIHNKDDVIAAVIKQAEIKDINDAVMIGDRHHDIEGAKKFGIKSIGVTYGFGDLEELQTAGADYIAHTPDQITALLLNV